jgi:hypothetical protein
VAGRAGAQAHASQLRASTGPKTAAGRGPRREDADIGTLNVTGPSFGSLSGVAGVMNIVWVAALAGLVLIEKVAPAGPLVGRLTGAVLAGWGLWLLQARR